jgi:aconitate hydratase
MGLVPLQFPEGVNAASLKLDGTETFDVLGLGDDLKPMSDVTLVIHRADGTRTEQLVRCRIDTAIEVDYVRHGGILPYVLRQLLSA